jgi:hypothetical protein
MTNDWSEAGRQRSGQHEVITSRETRQISRTEGSEHDHLDGQELVERLLALELVLGQIVPDDKTVQSDGDDDLRRSSRTGQHRHRDLRQVQATHEVCSLDVDLSEVYAILFRTKVAECLADDPDDGQKRSHHRVLAT